MKCRNVKLFSLLGISVGMMSILSPVNVAAASTDSVKTSSHEAQAKVTDTFIDVTSDKWYVDAVQFVYDKGIMSGTAENTFAPESTLSRAQAVTVLYNYVGKPSVKYSSQFADVENGKWYTQPILWAFEKSIVAGYPDGNYGRNDDVTRDQFAVILYKFATNNHIGVSRTEGILNNFIDKDKVPDWAQEAMEWAVSNGIMSGKPVGDSYMLDPKGNAKRAECASMVMKLLSEEETQWGAWSEWSETAVEPSETRQVQTEQRTRKVLTGTTYHYYHYKYFNVDAGKWYYTCDYGYASTHTDREVVTEYYDSDHDEGDYNSRGNEFLWWLKGQTDHYADEVYTVYRYRDLLSEQNETTWGAWSEWSETAVEASATRQVQTEQRTRKVLVSKYYYYRYKYWNNDVGAWYYTSDYNYASTHTDREVITEYYVSDEDEGDYNSRGSKFLWWRDEQKESYEDQVYTVYRYRDLL